MDEELYAGPRGSGEDGERHHTYARAKTELRSGRNHRWRVRVWWFILKKGGGVGGLMHFEPGMEKRRGNAAPSSGTRGFSATVEREEGIFGRRRVGGEEEKERCGS